MDADGDTGPGRHTLEILRTSPNGQPRHGATTSPGQPSADQQKGQADTDASPPLRLPGSFDAFYQEEYSGLVQLAFVLSGSRYGAEDIAQDALVAAWKKWPELIALEATLVVRDFP